MNALDFALRRPLAIMVAIVAIAVGSTLAGQGQPQLPGQGRGRGAPPPPPEPQAGHPSGKLVIWGDVASFDVPGTVPTHCILTNRFKRGQRMGFFDRRSMGFGHAANCLRQAIRLA